MSIKKKRSRFNSTVVFFFQSSCLEHNCSKFYHKFAQRNYPHSDKKKVGVASRKGCEVNIAGVEMGWGGGHLDVTIGTANIPFVF